MNDRDWLNKLDIAYKAYPHPNLNIENFIRWIYKQYGIVHNQEKK